MIVAETDKGQETIGKWVFSPWLLSRPYEISQGYGAADPGSPEPKGHGHARWHEGVDLEVPAGTTVVMPNLESLTRDHSVAAIAHRGIWNDEAERYMPDPEGYGPYALTVEMGPIDVILGHGVAAIPHEGQVIRPGDPLIVTGSEGNSTGPHLHVGVRKHHGVTQVDDLDPFAVLTGSLPAPRGGPAPTGLRPTDVPSWPPGGPQGGPAWGLGAGECPTSGHGGQCLVFVYQCTGQFAGVPAAKDIASSCNTNEPKKGFVFVTSEPPFGHTGFVWDDAGTQVLDSNFNLDEQISIHPLSDIQSLGPVCYIDLGKPFGGASPQGATSGNPFDSLGQEVSKAEQTAVQYMKGFAQVGLGTLLLAGAGFLLLRYTGRGRRLQGAVQRPIRGGLRSGRRIGRARRRGIARRERINRAALQRAQGGRAAPAETQGTRALRARGYRPQVADEARGATRSEAARSAREANASQAQVLDDLTTAMRGRRARGETYHSVRRGSRNELIIDSGSEPPF